MEQGDEPTQGVAGTSRPEPPPPVLGLQDGPPAELFPEEIGDFQLKRHLGQGGMGVVFLAVQKSLDRPVALKLLKPGDSGHPRARHLLFREARAASRLDHPGICPIYEIGEADGIPFLAMRFLEGETLAERIRAAREADPTGPDRKTALAFIQLLEEAARAVHAAHEAGLVHRDIKPSNIMITPGWKPVLLDFGLAREEKVAPGQATLAQGPLGTPTYMPPEQLEDLPSAPDRRTDVYALGVTLYEALTLRAPFEAPTWVQLYKKIRTADHPDPLQLNPRLPRDIRTVLAAAMEPDLARRYQSALDLAEDLRRVRLCLPPVVRPAGPLVRLRRWGQRNPILAASVLGLFLLLSAGLMVSLTMLGLVQRSLIRARALGLATASALQVASDPMQALLLAREGARISPLPETLTQLLATLQEARESALIGARENWTPPTCALSPSGAILSAATDEGDPMLYDLSGAKVAHLEADEPGDPPGRMQIFSLAFSPKGDCIATLAQERTRDGRENTMPRLSLWDLSGKRLIPSRDLHPKSRGVDFAADGKSLIIPSLLGSVGLYDLEGRETGRFQTFPHGFDFWLLHPGAGLFLALKQPAGIGPGEVGLWNLAGKELLRRPFSDLLSNPRASFSPDGRRIGVPCRQRVHVLDVERGEIACNQAAFAYKPTALAFAPDATQLAIGFEDGQVLLQDEAGAELHRWPAHFEAVCSLCFAPDGKSLLSVSKDRRAVLWTLDGKQICTLLGHEKELNQPFFTPDGKKIVTRSHDKTIRIWDVSIPGMPAFLTCSSTIAPIACRAGGSEVLAITPQKEIAAIDWEGNRRLLVPAAEDMLTALWTSAADGSFLTVHKPLHKASGRHVAKLWDARGGALATLEGHTTNIWSCAFSGTGGRIVTASADGTVRVWDAAGRQLQRLEGIMAPVMILSLSARGEYILAASRDMASEMKALVWDAEGKVAAVYPHEKRVTAAALSPSGLDALTGDTDGTVRLWRLGHGLVHLFPGAGKEVAAACFSPDGRLALAASKDSRARLWDAGSGRLLLAFEDVDSELVHAEFSPDGSRFLTASLRTVRIWDVAGPRELFRIRCPKENLQGNKLRCARFCPTGERILTTHVGNRIQVWPATPEGALALADRRAHRPLSAAERERHKELLEGR